MIFIMPAGAVIIEGKSNYKKIPQPELRDLK
jgi:hypothetical protein